MSWIKTLTGRKIDFLRPDPDQLDLRDIFLALARNHRFGGHSPLKVGQHILEVVTLMIEAATNGGGFEDLTGELTIKEIAEIGLVGMIHDMPEFAVCDVPTPLKRLLGNEYAEIEDRLLQTMLNKWDLKGPWEQHYAKLKIADQDAVEQEALRFGLDGRFVTDTNEVISTPNEWVPVRDVSMYAAPWPQDVVVNALTMTWVKLMILSGRENLVPDLYMEIPEMIAEETGVAFDVGLLQTNPMIPVILKSDKRMI